MSDNTEPSRELIVVGIDGSDASKAALRWAVRQTEMTGASLRVVTASQLPAMSYGYGAAMPTNLDVEGCSREILDATIKDVIGPDTSIALSTTVAIGPPAEALLDACEDADLLVVGSRGHGAFTGMLLGSVSEHCVSHASCPVVVVRCQSHKP